MHVCTHLVLDGWVDGRTDRRFDAHTARMNTQYVQICNDAYVRTLQQNMFSAYRHE